MPALDRQALALSMGSKGQLTEAKGFAGAAGVAMESEALTIRAATEAR
jgi:hypothetical protein